MTRQETIKECHDLIRKIRDLLEDLDTEAEGVTSYEEMRQKAEMLSENFDSERRAITRNRA